VKIFVHGLILGATYTTGAYMLDIWGGAEWHDPLVLYATIAIAYLAGIFAGMD
jgi:hypothetical protein